MQLRIAVTPLSRLKGLLFSRDGNRGIDKDADADTALVLVPCNDIHTFFMKRELDVAFLNKRGVVLASYRRVKPWRRLHHKKAFCVLEAYYRQDKSWYRVGDQVFMMKERG